ncbi:hypothetical protein HDU87_003786 [Geranomyces variabilis]|uniref:DUF676 domain-containing protein n=1 Tax=Geranomyces variabilis TaxID=109894 RepID=A0AAD5XS72_9FUNG|nr:hypothetical protein HDU87_003786 [Geranomyces variabilis]
MTATSFNNNNNPPSSTALAAAAEAPLPPVPHGQPKKILIVLIHGFLGSEESFFSFPSSLVDDMESRLGYPTGRIETRMFPRYDTRGHNARSVQKLIDWLLVYATTGRYESVVLMAHSMGGLLAADAYQYMYALHKEKVEERLEGQTPAAATAEGKAEKTGSTPEPTTNPTDDKADATTGIEGELAKLDLSLKHAVTKEEERDAAAMADVAAAINAAADAAAALPPADDSFKKADTSDSNAPRTDAGLSDSSQPANVQDGAAKVPNSSPAGSNLSALSSWFGSWRGAATSKPTYKDPTRLSAPSDPAADEDGFEGTSATSPDSDLRLLVNVRGLITFDSPFYGLHANVITQAGTNKAVAIMSEGIFNARAYLPAAVETVSAYAPKTIAVPTGLAGVRSVPIPTSWVVDAAKRVVGSSGGAAATPNQSSAPGAETTPTGASSQPEDLTPTPTTALAIIPATAPSVPTFASRVPNWVGYALGGAAVAATAYTIAPLAAAYIPASMIASSVATSFAISGAEQIRDHLHFLYPLVNSQWDMHARVCMLRREMEARKRLTFIGFYLDLPPLAGQAKAAKAKEDENEAKEREARREWQRQQPIQMMDLDAESPLEELLSMPTPYAAAAQKPTDVDSNAPPPVPPRPAPAAPLAPTTPATPNTTTTTPPSTPSAAPPNPTPLSASPPPPQPPATRNFCNRPPSDTAHLFRPVTHPHENEIDAHMNLFNVDCGREWYDDLVRRTADAVKEVLDMEERRGKDGVLRV